LILGLYGDENQADIGEPNIGEPQGYLVSYRDTVHGTFKMCENVAKKCYTFCLPFAVAVGVKNPKGAVGVRAAAPFRS
jgi:hypothetical protein